MQGFAVQNNQPAYHQQRGTLPLYGKNIVKSTSKRQSSQRSMGDKVKRTIYICDIDQQVQHVFLPLQPYQLRLSHQLCICR